MSEARPYIEALRALIDAGVEFAITGGFAAVLHGVPRMTFDLDIIVNLSDKNMQVLVATLKQQGYKPRLPVALEDLARPGSRLEWQTHKNLIAFSVHHPARPLEEIDILIFEQAPWQDVRASLVFRSIDGIQVPLIGKALLRRLKLATGRPKDLQDAELLGRDDE